METSFALGATFFLQKPIDRQKLNTLFRTVRGGLLENRRRYTRVPLNTEVTCQIGSRIMRGMSWNLSQGGVQVEASNLTPGDTVRVSFRLPVSDTAVEAVGVVVWAKENRQGIQFTNVSEHHQQSVRDFVASVEE
jgi:c-di-GMP-binding flagellar brake protein YcgR